MSFSEAIASKRDGHVLERDQIAQFVAGATRGTLPPEQLAAMLMAICCRGMSEDETRWLTEEMLHSGERWRLADDRPEAVDKHSTGGVGDTVSLVFAPLLAAVGVPVAMMAGRGLGHSQGTLDKLDAIPGLECERTRDEVLALLDRCGVAFVAQSERIAPADRVLYALRDVTGTVPSLPLMVSSIMSKKLALGAGTLVLDVKWGRGAFRSTVALAGELGGALRAVARGVGVAAEALITDMNQPLGPALGTACEVRAARAVLSGSAGGGLAAVSLRLAREALVLRGWRAAEAEVALRRALDSGHALETWERAVAAHGGTPDPTRMARPRQTCEVTAAAGGWVVGVAADSLGRIAAELGAGRRRRDEQLAHGAGLEVLARIGDRVTPGQPVAAVLIGERAADLDAIAARVRAAFELADGPVEPPPLVVGTVDQVGLE